MTATKPHALASLLEARNAEDREEAWHEFLLGHSSLILHAARRASSGHDDVMDRYAYVLDRLREDDFRRLKAFSANGAGTFTTWLFVVVRRLCIDHHRSRVGRDDPRAAESPDAMREAKRNLALWIGEALEPNELPAAAEQRPDAALIRRERQQCLTEVLAELTTPDQLLLTLRYVDGHSPETVSRMLGFSSRFVVHRRLRSLTKALRKKLRERGIEP